MSSDPPETFGAPGPPPPPPPGYPPGPAGAGRGLATVAFAMSFVGVLEAVWILLLGFTAADQCAPENDIARGFYLGPAVVLLAMPVLTFLLRRARNGPPLALSILAVMAVVGLDFLGAGWSFIAIFWTDPC